MMLWVKYLKCSKDRKR